jgi:hypothetical protein
MENEDTFDSPFDLKTLEEAATLDFLNLQEGLHPEDVDLYKCYQAFYLEQVYGLIQATMEEKSWHPLDADLLCKWEDQLWKIFLTENKDLNEFIPNCERAGYTLFGVLWIVLCGLSLLNHHWRPEPPWKKVYNEGATGKMLPFVLGNFLMFSDRPIIAHTTNELMGQIFTLSTRFYDLDYHPELEIWILWLQTKVAELMYIVTSRDLFNSREYCAPRPYSSEVFKIPEDSPQALFGVSDSFVQETARLFFEIRGTLYRYRLYPRLLVECSSKHTKLRERQITFPDIATLQIPILGNLVCEHNYVSQFFFSQSLDEEAIISTRWKTWVAKRLDSLYHDRSKITLHKTGLVQLLRPGEQARSTANNQGIAPGYYEILKKNRPTGALDTIDWHTFNRPKDQVMASCCDLNRRPNRVKDSVLLYLIDQYLYHNFSIRFISCFCKQEHEWTNNYDDLEKNDHPILIQTLGGYDVYCTGEIIQTRNLGRAFLIWCYKIASVFMGNLFGAINIQPMLKELLFSEEPPQVEVTATQSTTPQKKNTTSYWI